jgi:hypothetical protein
MPGASPGVEDEFVTGPARRPVLVLGVTSLASTLAGLYCYGSAEPRSRFAGLAWFIAGGTAAWLGERIRSRSSPLGTAKSRAHYLLIAFLTLGVVGFAMPPESRVRVIRFLLVFLFQALKQVH